MLIACHFALIKTNLEVWYMQALPAGRVFVTRARESTMYVFIDPSNSTHKHTLFPYTQSTNPEHTYNTHHHPQLTI
jgi:hypothetical protein